MVNDDFDDFKTTVKGYYVTPWALIDCNMESFLCKWIKHQTHKILVSNHMHAVEKNSSKNKYIMILFTNTGILTTEKSVHMMLLHDLLYKTEAKTKMIIAKLEKTNDAKPNDKT